MPHYNDVLKKKRIIGYGQYSKVYEVYDNITDTNLALKRNFTYSDVQGCSNLREVDILARLNGHPFIISTNKVFFGNPFCPENPLTPRTKNENKDDDIHFALEILPLNLKTFIDRFDRDESYYTRIKLYIIQLLISTDYIHRMGIVHRDIKPQNILVGSDSNEDENEINDRIRLSDFGMSLNMTNNDPSTPGTITSWYRAPEVAMACQYNTKADMWSVGCVIYEMVTGKPLVGGVSDAQQEVYSNLLAVCDVSEQTLCNMWENSYTDRYRITAVRSREKWYKSICIDNEELFNKVGVGGEYKELLEVLSMLIVFDPDERASAADVLSHVYFTDMADYINQGLSISARGLDEFLTVVAIPERRYMSNMAIQNIFNKKSTIPWYKHRILFHAVDIFDRYLAWAIKNTNMIKTAVVTDKLIKIHPNNEDVGLRFAVCLYMMYKYFLSLNTDEYSWPNFVKFINPVYARREELMKDFEILILEHVLRYEIYHTTIYELLPVGCSDKDIGEYLKSYTELKPEQTIWNGTLTSLVH